MGGSTCRYSFSGGTYKGGEEAGRSVGTAEGREGGSTFRAREREEGRGGTDGDEGQKRQMDSWEGAPL